MAHLAAAHARQGAVEHAQQGTAAFLVGQRLDQLEVALRVAVEDDEVAGAVASRKTKMRDGVALGGFDVAQHRAGAA